MAMYTQQGEIVQNEIVAVFRLCTQLQGKFVISVDSKSLQDVVEGRLRTKTKKWNCRLDTSQQIRQICILKLKAMALHLVFLIHASNKSALVPTECFLKEIEKVKRMFPPERENTLIKLETSTDRDFLKELLRKLAEIPGGTESYKPGVVARIVNINSKYHLHFLL